MEHSEWQSLLKLGNQSFHEKHWQQAEFFYSEAYDLLAIAYRNDPLSSDLLMAWICSCHNLATLYENLGNISLSWRFLIVPHDYMHEVIQAKGPSDDAKLIATKAMSLILPPILAFTKKHPVCNECIEQFGLPAQFGGLENSHVH